MTDRRDSRPQEESAPMGDQGFAGLPEHLQPSNLPARAYILPSEQGVIDQLKADLHGTDPVRRQQAYELLGIIEGRPERERILAALYDLLDPTDPDCADCSTGYLAELAAKELIASRAELAAVPDLSALKDAWKDYTSRLSTIISHPEPTFTRVLEEVRRLCESKP